MHFFDPLTSLCLCEGPWVSFCYFMHCFSLVPNSLGRLLSSPQSRWSSSCWSRLSSSLEVDLAFSFDSRTSLFPMWRSLNFFPLLFLVPISQGRPLSFFLLLFPYPHFLGKALEFPSITLVIFLLIKAGRRLTLILFYTLAGVGSNTKPNEIMITVMQKFHQYFNNNWFQLAPWCRSCKHIDIESFKFLSNFTIWHFKVSLTGTIFIPLGVFPFEWPILVGYT